MLSVLRTTSPQHQNPSSDPKPRLKSVLGFGSSSPAKDSAARAIQRSSAVAESLAHRSYSRRSVDTITDLQVNKRKKNKADRPTTPDLLSFDHDAVTVVKPANDSDTMKNGSPAESMPSRRMPFRVDGQDGPWAISVAESPHDATSYILYVKTPTHNLTLTRLVLEIVEMDGKLRDSLPHARLPPLPIDASAVPSPPPKRKSAFLNTLSRLASPSSSKNAMARHASYTRPFTSPSSNGFQLQAPSLQSSTSSTAQTPIASPSQEINDPFTSLAQDAATPLPTNATVTSLAAYLTTLANDISIRQTRTWKRFVRVRTDDLQSVRVERAIKRVRSDLASHAGTTRSVAQVLDEGTEQNATLVHSSLSPATPTTPVERSVDGVGRAAEGEKIGAALEASRTTTDGIAKSEDVLVNGSAKEVPVTPTTVDEPDRSPTPQDFKRPSIPAAPSPTLFKPISLNGVDSPIKSSSAHADEEVPEPTTPVAESSSHASRIPRSQSADPTSRASRIIYSPSSGVRDGTSSKAASVTGDDSSISTNGRSARKKRSKSTEPKKSQRKVVVDDFEMMRVLGKGCAGKVLLVKHKPTADVYALKAITKRHVLAHQELQHTLTEQAVLKRMAAEGTDPFVVKLWWSFHDKENLFLVMDFHPGGDLATQLARWGRLGRDRARFYAAEIVEGVEGLHAAGVIYRDLKPENILIGADGHIVLTDFGLSKEFPRKSMTATAPSTPSATTGGVKNGDYMDGASPTTAASPPWMKNGQELAWNMPNDTTTTFCGTAEYLAPEVIQGLPYSYEVDWWSFGTMLYEMLTGITPFWANNHSDMYYRVLQDELQFPEDRTMDQDTKSLIRGLLQRNPALRMKEPRIKKHPYFSMIDWSHVYYKRYIPPYIPPIDPSNASDTQNFDDTFLDMEPVIKDEHDDEQTDTDQDRQTDTDRTDGEDSVATPSQSRSPSVHPADEVDVFDGYSFKGRHSVILDDDEDGEGEEEEEDDESGPGEDEEDSLATASLNNILPEDRTGLSSADITTVEEVPEPEPNTPEARLATLPDEPTPVLPAVPEPEPKPEPVKAVVPEPELPPPPVPKKEPHLIVDTTVPAALETPTPATFVSALETPPTAEPSPAQTTAAAPMLPPFVPVLTPVVPVPAPTLPIAAVVEDMTKAPRLPPKSRNRREKSGIPALDRNLEDTADEGAATERDDDDDDDWDFVETNVHEERNGPKPTLFARGVVDRYRLAVFRKSTPRRSTTGGGGSSTRNFSGISVVDSEFGGPSEASDSPSPSEKQRRGRNPGLSFRRNPKQFLRAKSPPSSPRGNNNYSNTSKSGKSSTTVLHSVSATLTASTSSSAGLLTPSPSIGGSTIPPFTPSLKSKESATSVSSPASDTSDQSMNGDLARFSAADHTVKAGVASSTATSLMITPPVVQEEEKSKSKGLKKYKEGAEKVLSIFQSPR